MRRMVWCSRTGPAQRQHAVAQLQMLQPCQQIMGGARCCGAFGPHQTVQRHCQHYCGATHLVGGLSSALADCVLDPGVQLGVRACSTASGRQRAREQWIRVFNARARAGMAIQRESLSTGWQRVSPGLPDWCKCVWQARPASAINNWHVARTDGGAEGQQAHHKQGGLHGCRWQGC
jgi:hypothetical protein